MKTAISLIVLLSSGSAFAFSATDEANGFLKTQLNGHNKVEFTGTSNSSQCSLTIEDKGDGIYSIVVDSKDPASREKYDVNTASAKTKIVDTAFAESEIQYEGAKRVHLTVNPKSGNIKYVLGTGNFSSIICGHLGVRQTSVSQDQCWLDGASVVKNGTVANKFSYFSEALEQLKTLERTEACSPRPAKCSLKRTTCNPAVSLCSDDRSDTYIYTLVNNKHSETVVSLGEALKSLTDLRSVGLCSDEKSDCRIGESVSYPGYSSKSYPTLFVDNNAVVVSYDQNVISQALDKLKAAGVCR